MPDIVDNTVPVESMNLDDLEWALYSVTAPFDAEKQRTITPYMM